LVVLILHPTGQPVQYNIGWELLLLTPKVKVTYLRWWSAIWWLTEQRSRRTSHGRCWGRVD